MWEHFDKGDTIAANKAVADADPSDYDGLVLPGGLANPDQLPMNGDAVKFVRRSGTRSPRGRTRDQLYNEARKLGVRGRSKMNKSQLRRAVDARK